jgi:cysteine-rich repeat protein
MVKVWLGAAGLAAIGWLVTPVHAQEPCAGDCDGSETVAINELVRCVNITLGSQELSTCDACDVNGDDEVRINELIASVNGALTDCDNGPPPMARCGNGTMETGEECDDGNNFGGDPCAANCTLESERLGTFESTQTRSSVQSFGALIGPLMLSGTQTLRVGKPRDTDTLGPDGEVLFKANEIPVAIRASELNIQPVSVLGALCACVRGIPVPESFGEGVSGSGKVSCSDEGLTDVNYRVVQDHNTTPDDPFNMALGSPNDPECDDVSQLPGGTTSTACVEGTGAECSNERFIDTGVCNGPRILTQSGGPAGRGSTFILNNSAIGQLSGGNCDMTGPRPGGTCPALLEDYGPDCLPCTDDDLEKGTANNLPTTSGTAEAAIFDANNNDPGPQTIDKDLPCNSQGAICQTSVTGRPVNCDAIISGEGALGGALAVAFPGLHSATLRDVVTTTLFVNEEE